MLPIHLILLLLAWSTPGNTESEEKRTTVTSHAVTTDPIPLSSNNGDRHHSTNAWDSRGEWQKGWHDGWPLEYDSNRAEWRNQPYSNYGQATTDHRTYGNVATDYPHRNYNQQGEPTEFGYSNLYGYGYNRHPYPPYNDRYNHYGGYGNYGSYGHYGQRPSQGIYNYHNRRGSYRPKSNYVHPYYGYDKGWSNGR